VAARVTFRIHEQFFPGNRRSETCLALRVHTGLHGVMTAMSQVVVGVDDGSAAANALEWTTTVLAPDATIHAVNAVSPGVELAVAVVQYDSAALVARRRRYLEGDWTAGARRTGATIVCDVIEDHPARALMRAATRTGAGMIVVGMKGRRVPHVLTGVVRDVLAHAQQPVVVVPDGATAPSAGAVVVDVGGAGRLRDALRWAAGFAVDRGFALNLVSAAPRRKLFSMDGSLERRAYSIDRDVVKSWAYEDLAALAEQIQRSTDDELDISWSVGDGHRPRIVEAPTDTALVVVDVHADEGAHVTSWVHDTIKHTPCPVAIFGTPLEPLVGLPPIPG
jgi:hypothetical protein